MMTYLALYGAWIGTCDLRHVFLNILIMRTPIQVKENDPNSTDPGFRLPCLTNESRFGGVTHLAVKPTCRWGWVGVEDLDEPNLCTPHLEPTNGCDL